MSDAEIEAVTPDDDTLAPDDFGASSPPPDPRRRRRILWAVVLLVVGVLAGAVAGWTSREPIYRSVGLIYVAPSMPSPQDPAGLCVLPMFEGYMAYQVQILRSRRTTQMAMETEAWRTTGARVEAAAIRGFERRRSVVHTPKTHHILARFDDPDPDVAIAGVRALLDAYQKLSADLNGADVRLEYTRRQVEVLTMRIKSETDQILALTSEFGGVDGLRIRHQAVIENELRAEADLERVRSEIRDFETTQGADQPTLKQWERRERALVSRVTSLRAQSHKLGRSRFAAGQLQAELDDLTRRLKQVDALREQLTAQLVGTGRISIEGPGSTPTAPFCDRRLSCAAKWAGFGAIPGVLALLLLALAGRGARRRPCSATLVLVLLLVAGSLVGCASRQAVHRSETLHTELSGTDDRLAHAREQVEVLRGRIKEGTEQILMLTREYGGVEGLRISHRASVEQVLSCAHDLEGVRNAIRDHQDPPKSVPPGEIAVENPQMAQYLLDLELLQAEEAHLAERLGDKSERMIDLRRRIHVLGVRIERFASDWNRVRAASHADGITLEALKEREKQLEERLQALQTRSRKIGQAYVEVERLRARNDDLARRLQQMEALE